MAATLKVPVRKQAKSFTIKSAWIGIAIGLAGLGIAADQLRDLAEQHGQDMFTARQMGWIMLALSIAKMASSAGAWWGRYRSLATPPAEPPAKQEL